MSYNCESTLHYFYSQNLASLHILKLNLQPKTINREKEYMYNVDNARAAIFTVIALMTTILII